MQAFNRNYQNNEKKHKNIRRNRPNNHHKNGYRKKKQNSKNYQFDNKVKLFIKNNQNETDKKILNKELTDIFNELPRNGPSFMLCRAIQTGTENIVNAYIDGVFQIKLGGSCGKKSSHPLHYIAFSKNHQTGVKMINLIKQLKWSLLIKNEKGEVPHGSIFHNDGFSKEEQNDLYDNLTMLSPTQIHATLQTSLFKLTVKEDLEKQNNLIVSEVLKWCACCDIDVSMNIFIDYVLGIKPPRIFTDKSNIIEKYMETFINIINPSNNQTEKKIKELCLNRFFEVNNVDFKLNKIINKFDNILHERMTQLKNPLTFYMTTLNNFLSSDVSNIITHFIGDQLENENRIRDAKKKILFTLAGIIANHGSNIALNWVKNTLTGNINEITIIERINCAAAATIHAPKNIQNNMKIYFKNGIKTFPTKKAQILASIILKKIE